MIFAVFDSPPLIVCVNCSFFYIIVLSSSLRPCWSGA